MAGRNLGFPPPGQRRPQEKPLGVPALRLPEQSPQRRIPRLGVCRRAAHTTGEELCQSRSLPWLPHTRLLQLFRGRCGTQMILMRSPDCELRIEAWVSHPWLLTGGAGSLFAAGPFCAL